MNKRSSPVDELQQELFERQLFSIASEMDYPSTPDISRSALSRLQRTGRASFPSRRLAWSLMLILILFSSLMLIPPVRAAVIEFIQIGVVRIFRAEPIAPPPQQFPSTTVPLTATPGSAPQPIISILERLGGETTLEEAQQAVDYRILLPSYPPNLGHPNRVFVQDAEGDMTILVWIDPGQPDDVSMSLHLIPEGSWAIEKVSPTVIRETTVNGQRAIWTMGPYPIRYTNGNIDFVRLVDGPVLIWTEGDMTYRLETDLSMEEAVRIAESLEPVR